MKTFHRLLLTALFLFYFWFTSISQKNSTGYTDFDYGSYYLSVGKLDSAFLKLNRYVNNPDDTLNKGKAYNFMGQIQWQMGDLYGAQQSLTGTIHTLDSGNINHHEQLGYAYSLLGNVSLDLKLYDEALQFYDNALPFFKASNYAIEILNGKATAFQKMENYNAAIAIYDSILLQKPNNQSLVARIIDNRAKTKWLQDSSYTALSEFQSALKIRIDSQYKAGLNASYAHLSDYYAKSNPDSALWYAQKMYETAKANQSPDDILEALDKLIRLNHSPITKAFWYDELKKLNDSIQFSRDTTRNRFALIRFDVQKSKADNLVLQQHISKQQIMLYSFIALATIIIVALWLWYNKRKRKIKQDSENAIKDASLKTSQKVHDVVANGLYTIMNELEHKSELDREPLIGKIEDLYEKSRNISYEDIQPINNIDDHYQMHQLLNSFSNEQTRIIIVGNESSFWKEITQRQKQELRLVLRELMVNMNKHSAAKNVFVVFKQENGKAIIHYKDDGIGMKAGATFGNGLNNTANRIKSIHGVISFERSEHRGLSISMSIPLIKKP